MNLRNPSLHAFALALALALAAPAHANDDRALVLRCDAPAPSIRDVAQAFDIDNYDQAYDVRIRARMIAQRLCARGAGSVLLVLEPQGRDAVLRGAAVAQNDPR